MRAAWWTPSRLVHEAVKSQYARWDELSKLVMTPLKEGEVEMWPEHPLCALACMILHNAMQRFIKAHKDPVGFEEENKKAPAEWSFSSGDEDDSADWWKAADYPPKRPINIELSPENAAVVAYYAPY